MYGTLPPTILLRLEAGVIPAVGTYAYIKYINLHIPITEAIEARNMQGILFASRVQHFRLLS